MNKKIINLIKLIVDQADNAKINKMMDCETLKEKECKEITLNISVDAINSLKEIVKEFEDIGSIV